MAHFRGTAVPAASPKGRSFTLRHRPGTECITPVGLGVTKPLKALFREARMPPLAAGRMTVAVRWQALSAVSDVAIAEGRAVRARLISLESSYESPWMSGGLGVDGIIPS